ncbi:MAG: Nif3-like dinuclear metal center hexameric protein [Flammeovirgaceae bacterium]
MVLLKNIIRHLEQIAPISYQESYDNAGLLMGDLDSKISRVLISLDCTEEVVEEAIQKKCQLIVAHHPIIFKGLKKITGKNYVERTILKAIKNDIALYAIHTNLDHVHTGVNRKIGEQLGLKNLKILAPKEDSLCKLVTFVPLENVQNVLDALSEAGAGNIGNYKKCSFQVEGIGTFLPSENANPHIGEKGKIENVRESRVEVILPKHIKYQVLNALKNAHPYEEVAYYLTDLQNINQEVGAGMVGDLPQEMETTEFLKFLKERMKTSCIRHTRLLRHTISRVALCGGAGSFLLPNAKRESADIFITGDFKYHEFFDAENQIIIADIGHYESEQFTKELLKEFISQVADNLNIFLCEVNTNPIQYYF